MIPPELLLLALLFAVNRLALPRVLQNAPVFWLVNGLDVVGAGYVYVRGFPGLEDQAAVRLLIGTLLLFHVAQNLSLRARERERVELAKKLRDAKLAAARLHADAQGPSAEPPGPSAEPPGATGAD